MLWGFVGLVSLPHGLLSVRSTLHMILTSSLRVLRKWQGLLPINSDTYINYLYMNIRNHATSFESQNHTLPLLTVSQGALTPSCREK